MTNKVEIKTMSEFTAWLAGIEEMQAIDWSPDASQWKVIREKLASVTDAMIATEAAKAVPRPAAPTFNGMPAPVVANPEPLIAAPPDVDMSPEAKAMLSGSGATVQSPIKTPDGDNSGGYSSSFT